MAMTIHLEFHGVPLAILLDITEVAKSHMGMVLAEEFSHVLNKFEIAAKVSRLFLSCDCLSNAYVVYLEVVEHYW
jgi:hypothetical protein